MGILTSPQEPVIHLAQGKMLHNLLLDGFFPFPRQCLVCTSLKLASGPIVQRTRLDWDPPPQEAEHGAHVSTRHLAKLKGK